MKVECLGVTTEFGTAQEYACVTHSIDSMLCQYAHNNNISGSRKVSSEQTYQ